MSAGGSAPGPPAGQGRAPGAMRDGLLGLGCNLGNRRAHLQAAVDALPAAGIEVLACSSVYDTDPVGEVLDQPSFLNACASVRTALGPLELLDAVKRIEREHGRDGDGVRHGPRVIDIDVLLLGGLTLEDATGPGGRAAPARSRRPGRAGPVAPQRMRLPHEQLLHRRFVLVPALELDFALRTPQGVRLADALAALGLSEGVRWAGPPLEVPAGPVSAR